MLNDEQKKTLLKLARNTIENYIIKGIMPRFENTDEVYRQEDGAFVTIHNKGKLRGCIGLIESKQRLYETIIEMSIEASRNDPRFDAVSEDELKDMDIEISVLTKPERAGGLDDIELGKHGVIIKNGFVSGVFLPQVATEQGWTKQQLMENLCEGKAGLRKDAYKDPATQIYIFEAEVFGEKDFA